MPIVPDVGADRDCGLAWPVASGQVWLSPCRLGPGHLLRHSAEPLCRRPGPRGFRIVFGRMGLFAPVPTPTRRRALAPEPDQPWQTPHGNPACRIGPACVARGNRDEARAFLGALRWFDHRVADANLRSQATEFLVVDAASQGAWRTVEALTDGPPRRLTQAAHFLGAIARRLLRRPHAPSVAELTALRNALPRSQHPPRGVWERALEAIEPSTAQGGSPTASTLEYALQAHLSLVREPAGQALNTAVQAWESAWGSWRKRSRGVPRS